jgi:hypothetical protein
MWIDIYTICKCDPAYVVKSERVYLKTCSDYVYWVFNNYYANLDEYLDSFLKTVDEYSHI